MIAKRGELILQGVTDANVKAYSIVRLTGTISGALPVVTPATNEYAGPVFVASMPPDNYPKPSNSTWYRHNDVSVNTMNWQYRVESGVYYLDQPATIPNFTIQSGFRVQLHAGGCIVQLNSGMFTPSYNMFVPGTYVACAENGTVKEATGAMPRIGFVVNADATKNVVFVQIN